MNFHRIGIIGLGLIGGSLGLDLQKLGYEVCGLVRQEKTATKAKARGLAQNISTNPSIISNCSVVILALPLSQLVKPTPELIDILPINAVITDVGSVKTPVIDTWRTLHPRFVGSHPMAGTIETGVEAGQSELFKNRPWIATPEKTTDLEAIEVIQKIADELGSNWITTEPEIHDQAVALISHLPVFTSAALLHTVALEQNDSLLTLAKNIASSGFADTTRVGGGNPDLGVAMAEHNTAAVLNAINAYRLSIDKIEKIIRAKQWELLKQELEYTKSTRPHFLEQKLSR